MMLTALAAVVGGLGGYDGPPEVRAPRKPRPTLGPFRTRPLDLAGRRYTKDEHGVVRRADFCRRHERKALGISARQQRKLRRQRRLRAIG